MLKLAHILLICLSLGTLYGLVYVPFYGDGFTFVDMAACLAPFQDWSWLASGFCRVNDATTLREFQTLAASYSQVDLLVFRHVILLPLLLVALLIFSLWQTLRSGRSRAVLILQTFSSFFVLLYLIIDSGLIFRNFSGIALSSGFVFFLAAGLLTFLICLRNWESLAIKKQVPG